MKLKKKWEVAKVGKWNDFPITEDILKDIEKNNASMTAPIRPGHTEIKSGQKCEGSLTNPVFEDGSVVFDIELKEGLAESWQNGEYINWSMDLKKYPDIGWAVSGLALLGAESPGIKGLQEIEYSETSVNKPVVFRNDDKSEMTLLFSEKPKETFSQIEIDLKDVLKYIKKTTLDDKVKIVTAVTGSIKEDDKKAIREMAWFKEFNENNNNNNKENLMDEELKELMAKMSDGITKLVDNAEKKKEEFNEEEKSDKDKKIEELEKKIEDDRKELFNEKKQAKLDDFLQSHPAIKPEDKEKDEDYKSFAEKIEKMQTIHEKAEATPQEFGEALTLIAVGGKKPGVDDPNIGEDGDFSFSEKEEKEAEEERKLMLKMSGLGEE